jgi:lipoprotein NlpI
MADYDKAVADYGEEINLLSEYKDLLPDALANRAAAYSLKGDYDAAIADLDRAIDLSTDKELFYLRGRAYSSTGSYKKSIEDYDRAIELDPTYRDALYSRGVSHGQQQEYGLAIADFRRAIEADPADAYSALRLFLVRAKSEPSAAAEELSGNAVRFPRMNWPYPIVELLLGVRTADATLAAASSPTELCDAHFFLGERSLLEGDSSLARRFLNSAESICSKDSTMYFVAREEGKRLHP